MEPYFFFCTLKPFISYSKTRLKWAMIHELSCPCLDLFWQWWGALIYFTLVSEALPARSFLHVALQQQPSFPEAETGKTTNRGFICILWRFLCGKYLCGWYCWPLNETVVLDLQLPPSSLLHMTRGLFICNFYFPRNVPSVLVFCNNLLHI